MLDVFGRICLGGGFLWMFYYLVKFTWNSAPGGAITAVALVLFVASEAIKK